MLNRILHRHLDKTDVLNEQVDKDIDKLIQSIDIESVMITPQATIFEIVQELEELLIEKYGPQAVENGLKLALVIKRMQRENKDIIIQDTDDPNINQDLLEDV